MKEPEAEFAKGGFVRPGYQFANGGYVYGAGYGSTFAGRELPNPTWGPSPEWVREQLARFTYKPGWKFEVRNSDIPPAAYVAISFEAEDTYNPGKIVNPGMGAYLYEVPDTEDRFAAWLASKVKAMEVHESREWLRRDGQMWDDPHASLARSDNADEALRP